MLLLHRQCSKGLLRTTAMLIAAIMLLSTIVLAQPDWQPSGKPYSGKINGSEWSTTNEKREWTKEDGTKVTETRTTTTKKTNGKTEYTEVDTTTKEEKADSKSQTRKKETTDSSGKKSSIEQKFTETKTPEGTKRTSEFKKDGKLEGSSTTNDYDPPKADGTYREEESIQYDKDGKPIKKIRNRYLKIGKVLTDEYMWDPKTGAWGPSTGTKIVDVSPPKVVAPSTSTSGKAVGGSISQEGVKATSGGTIVAESTTGEKREVEFNIDGGWNLPPGMLTAGIWLLSALLPDGSKGLLSILQVMPPRATEESARLTGVPGINFSGSAITLNGTGFTGLDGSRVPTLWFDGAAGPFSMNPAAYSDTEAICSLPAGSQTGEHMVFVDNGSSFSNPIKTNLVSFDIIVPAVTKVGQQFTVTVKLTGLAGEYLSKEFTAQLSIIGPARFATTLSKEATVILKQGIAQVNVIAESAGAFDISGTLVSMP